MTLSSSLEHSPSEEIEVGSAVHLSLEQLQLVDLAFGLTIAPLQREPGFDRCSIVRQAAREPVQLGDATGGGPRQPRIEPPARSLTSQAGRLGVGDSVGAAPGPARDLRAPPAGQASHRRSQHQRAKRCSRSQ
jgi:hypothetical protein